MIPFPNKKYNIIYADCPWGVKPVEDKMICGFCIHYDDDEVWCPYKGEVYPEDTCSNWTGDVEDDITLAKAIINELVRPAYWGRIKESLERVERVLILEELEAQKVDAAERENHRKEVEGEIV